MEAPPLPPTLRPAEPAAEVPPCGVSGGNVSMGSEHPASGTHTKRKVYVHGLMRRLTDYAVVSSR
jgi:hypothetical protein